MDFLERKEMNKTFKNEDLGIELNSYIDKQQNIWFLRKDVAEILGYSKTRDALLKHVDSEDKKLFCRRPQNVDVNNNQCLPGKIPGQQNCCRPETGHQQNDTRGKYYTFINESGFYSLVLSSKLEKAKKFKKWVTSQVLPSIRKYGYYKLFDNLNNRMFKIENDYDKISKLIHKYMAGVRIPCKYCKRTLYSYS